MALSITTLNSTDNGSTSRNTINSNFANILASYPTSAVLVGTTDSQTLTNKTLTSAILTTPTINVGSDATGDIYYRNSGGAFTRLGIGSNNQVIVSNGTIPTWATPAGLTNASTTTAGISQEATLAQVLAGTQTGSTGADLFVNPSTFASAVQQTAYKTISMLASESITSGNTVYANFYQSDGGVSYDNKATANYTTSSSSTVNITIGNNSNRLVVVYVSCNAGAGVSGVQFNGSAMTAGPTALNSGAGIYTYYLFAPAVGAGVVIATMGGSTGSGSVTVYSYYNVVQGSFDSTNGVYSAPGSATISPTQTADGVVYLVGGSNSSGTGTITNIGNNGVTQTNGFGLITGDSGVVLSNVNLSFAGNASVAYLVAIGIKPITSPAYGYVGNTSTASPTNSANLNKYTTFLGFATNTATVGQSVTVLYSGIFTTTNLKPLKTYYLADSAGTISNTAGTNTKKIGVALTSTQLVLKDTI